MIKFAPWAGEKSRQKGARARPGNPFPLERVRRQNCIVQRAAGRQAAEQAKQRRMKVAMLALLCAMPFGMTTGNSPDKPFTEVPSEPPSTADTFLPMTTQGPTVFSIPPTPFGFEPIGPCRPLGSGCSPFSIYGPHCCMGLICNTRGVLNECTTPYPTPPPTTRKPTISSSP